MIKASKELIKKNKHNI